MLLCSIIDELKKSTPPGLLSFFFCQGTDSRINNATAVLRGLIYLLADQEPSLISHLRKKYDHLCDFVSGKLTRRDADLQDDGSIHIFLKNQYLYWLEALSLCKSIPVGVVSMAKLEALIQAM
jgi:hypothetical protein